MPHLTETSVINPITWAQISPIFKICTANKMDHMCNSTAVCVYVCVLDGGSSLTPPLVDLWPRAGRSLERPWKPSNDTIKPWRCRPTAHSDESALLPADAWRLSNPASSTVRWLHYTHAQTNTTKRPGDDASATCSQQLLHLAQRRRCSVSGGVSSRGGSH